MRSISAVGIRVSLLDVAMTLTSLACEVLEESSRALAEPRKQRIDQNRVRVLDQQRRQARDQQAMRRFILTGDVREPQADGGVDCAAQRLFEPVVRTSIREAEQKHLRKQKPLPQVRHALIILKS